MGLRRLGLHEGRDNERGVSVLMRYTLQLLTLQQFRRATALICACEATAVKPMTRVIILGAAFHSALVSGGQNPRQTP